LGNFSVRQVLVAKGNGNGMGWKWGNWSKGSRIAQVNGLAQNWVRLIEEPAAVDCQKC